MKDILLHHYVQTDLYDIAALFWWDMINKMWYRIVMDVFSNIVEENVWGSWLYIDVNISDEEVNVN